MLILIEAAKQGHLEFYISFEIDFELMSYRRGRRRRYIRDFTGELIANPLDELSIKKVAQPIERTIVFGNPSISTRKKQHKLEFLKSISDPRYRALDKATNSHHPVDAFHWWTAEEAGLDYFMTTDYKFIKIAQRQREVTSRVRVVSPADLCAILGYKPET